MKSSIVCFVLILFAASSYASSQQELLQDRERNPESYGIYKEPPLTIRLFRARVRVEAIYRSVVGIRAKLERDLKIEKAREEGKSVETPSDYIPTKDRSEKLQSKTGMLKIATAQLKELLGDPAAKSVSEDHIDAAKKALMNAETFLNETSQGKEAR